MALLILPHQLFDINIIKNNIPDKIEEIYLYEHPQYFTKYKFNKKKLVLHRASMKYYYDYLKDNNFKVKYFNYNENVKLNEYILFDPIDKITLKGKSTIIETPNFIMNKEQYAKYRDKTDKFMFTNFYMWCKKEIDLYPNLKSKDKYNRQTYKDTNIPD